MNERRVRLGDRAYDVLVGWGALETAVPGRFPDPMPSGRIALVTDTHVEPLYADAVRRRLEAAGREVHVFCVPAGEPSKSLRTAEALWGRLFEAGLDRTGGVVGLGGGVVGDLSGFVAAAYMRGLPCFLVPTTLLAQVDAAVGGKTGVNHPRCKNLVGVFAQPAGVLADPAVLRTLPPEEFASGLAEAVKAAVIADADLFDRIERSREEIRSIAPGPLEDLVARCVGIKADVVEADERETAGRRALLNLGHTVGHALESLAGFGTLRHGEAVAAGMVAAGRLACGVTGFPADEADRLEALLRGLGLPVRLPPGTDPDALLERMGGDKKRAGGRLRFVLPERIGRAVVTDAVPAAVVREVLRDLAA